jgi:crossover junction endodeoxyribonuclease RusA
MIELSIPHPPSVNSLYRNVPGRGRAKTERYKTWLTAAGWEIRRQRPGRIEGPYSLTIIVKRKNKRADLGNLVKAVEDILVAHRVIEDDCHASDIHLHWSDLVTDTQLILRPAGLADAVLDAAE